MGMNNYIRKEAKAYLIITLGLLVNALGWVLFLIPADITGGGVSGIAAIIYFATGFPMGVSYLAINVILILIAIRLLGASFGVKTIYSVVVLSVLFSVLQGLLKHPIVHDDFMATVIGGFMAGAGVGIVFTQGGSTGGTDIIAMIVNRYRNMSPGSVILLCDIFIISSSFLVFRSIEKVVFGFVVMAVTAYTIDIVISGARQSYQLFIFSKRYEQIAERIAREVHRGVTIVNGQGWYTKDDQKVLLVLVRKHEVNDVFRIIRQVDPKAFMSLAEVMGVYGEGFDRIRG
ncbi:MAG: YitT family protein [Bacteroidales bacterium]|nr:YitT family protein [Bacteroidales bacterium]